MSSSTRKSTIAVGAALAGGLALAGSAFAMQPLAQGYMVAAAAAAEGSCGAAHKDGEGKCGVEKMDADKDGRVSRAEFAAAHDNDDSKFAAHDPDGDGFITAEELKAHHEAKAGDKAGMEGKCGEGKCGGGA